MRGRAARAIVPALGVVALVGVVAVAATGSTPTGTGDSRRPSHTVLDTFLTIGVLLLIPGAVLLIYGLMQRKAIATEVASGRYRRLSVVAFLALVTAYGVASYFGLLRRPAARQEGGDVVLPGGDVPQETVTYDESLAYEARFALVPALIFLAVVALVAGTAYLAVRRRPTLGEPPGSVSAALADLLAETLDDLRAEADPRRAVIAAYARFERVLDAEGMPRRAPETPEEYLARILGSLDVSEAAVRRLTALFEEAKFSDHTVHSAMKEDAIAALQQVRDELVALRRPERPLAAQVPVGSA
jgi:hypothetical protein